jgi:hypothetical protein
MIFLSLSNLFHNQRQKNSLPGGGNNMSPPTCSASSTVAASCTSSDDELFVLSDDNNKKVTGSRRVRFGTVQIRNYFITLSDHPCCQGGPPIGLGWDYVVGCSVPVDQHQKATAATTTTTCDGDDDGENEKRVVRCIKSWDRVLMLQNAGYTNQEINDATRDALFVRKSRCKAVKALLVKKNAKKSLESTTTSTTASKDKLSTYTQRKRDHIAPIASVQRLRGRMDQMHAIGARKA